MRRTLPAVLLVIAACDELEPPKERAPAPDLAMQRIQVASWTGTRLDATASLEAATYARGSGRIDFTGLHGVIGASKDALAVTAPSGDAATRQGLVTLEGGVTLASAGLRANAAACLFETATSSATCAGPVSVEGDGLRGTAEALALGWGTSTAVTLVGGVHAVQTLAPAPPAPERRRRR